jgi:predicted regulator of Ras-like GTPase activity (Roadblock/LC7/MglB family)
VKRVDHLRTEMDKVMAELRQVPGITAVAIIRRDGIVIDHLLPKSVDAKKVAAMAAAIVGTSEMAATELQHARFEQSIVEAENGKIISVGAGEDALLVVLVEPRANLGLTLMTVEKQASRLGDFLAAC